MYKYEKGDQNEMIYIACNKLETIDEISKKVNKCPAKLIEAVRTLPIADTLFINESSLSTPGNQKFHANIVKKVREKASKMKYLGSFLAMNKMWGWFAILAAAPNSGYMLFFALSCCLE